MRTLRISTAALALAVSSGLTGAFGVAPATAAPAPGAAHVSLGASSERVVRPHDGQLVVLHKGDRVTLRLNACETCGYRWIQTQRPQSSIVDYQGRSSSSTACAGCVGGNADESFHFAAVQLGQTQLRLAYRAPSGARSKRVTVDLVVLQHARSTANSAVHVVRPGDTLYRLSRAALGRDATPPRVRELATRLYRDNRWVIGANPNFLLPGEALLVDLTALDPCGSTAVPRPCNG